MVVIRMPRLNRVCGEVIDQRLDQRGNRVLRGNDHGIQAELLSAFRGDRPDRGDHGRREKVGACSAPSISTKCRTVEALVNVTASI